MTDYVEAKLQASKMIWVKLKKISQFRTMCIEGVMLQLWFSENQKAQVKTIKMMIGGGENRIFNAPLHHQRLLVDYLSFFFLSLSDGTSHKLFLEICFLSDCGWGCFDF
jgi:hypothetical protein